MRIAQTSWSSLRVAAVTSFARATSRAKKASLLLFSVAVLLVAGAAEVRGQSALDGFDPNANYIVEVVVVQPDGKILIGGEFTTLAPNGGAAVTRNYIARLNPDGKILAGGSFHTIGGQPRYNIARLPLGLFAFDAFPDASARAQGSKQNSKSAALHEVSVTDPQLPRTMETNPNEKNTASPIRLL
jgi:Domain of unknown function (DUF5122) beta-propeller